MAKDTKDLSKLDKIDLEILRFLIVHPESSIRDIVEGTKLTLTYSAIQKRIAALKAENLLKHVYRLRRDSSMDVLSHLFKHHYLLGIVINVREVYHNDSVGNGNKPDGQNSLIKEIALRLYKEFGDELFVAGSVNITGARSEIVMNVYSNVDTMELIETIRRIHGVDTTETYHIIGEVHHSELRSYIEE